MVAIEEIPAEVKEGKALWVEIRSPDGMIWSGTAKSVTLPGTLGSMGILPRHAPLVSSLEVGVTRLGEAKAAEGSEGDGTVELVTGLGLVEVYQNQLLQLIDFGDRTPVIDVERAAASRDRAQERLSNATEDVDRARAEASLARAMLRLKYGSS